MNRTLAYAIASAGGLLALLGLGAVYLAGRTAEPPRVGVASVSGAAVHAEVFADLGGLKQPLGRWSGKFMLINFWATWCPPCIEEMPRLEVWHQNGPKSLQIVGIAADSRVNVEKFLVRHKISFPILVDEAKSLEFSRRLGNRTGLLPFSALLDPRGDVVATYLGKLDEEKISQIDLIVAKNTEK